MIHVSIESGDIDPFGYRENKGQIGSFNRVLSSMTSEVFEEIVKEVRFEPLHKSEWQKLT